MTSSVGVQYPQYPFFNAEPNYYYDGNSNSRGEQFYSHPVDEETYPSSSGSSGYGDTAPSGYGPSHYPADHPTGPSSTGYSAPVVHVPPPTKSFFGSLKKGSGTTMSALTLLSFFFFVNLLQSCLKEHMDTMNPTVMVMTNKFPFHKTTNDDNSKIVEVNSREQTSSPASTPSTNEETENIEIKSSSIPPATIAATLNSVQHMKPDYDNSGIVDSNHNLNSSPISTNQQDSYDPTAQYRNRTGYSESSTKVPEIHRPQNYYDDDYYGSSYHGDRYPSHHSIHSHYGHQFHDPYSSYWDEYDTRRYPNHDAYDGASYLRIY